jgi:endonuclease/exonuclease/phosphatase family metal-dependent hydrolase
MTERDPALRAESRALRQALMAHRSLAGLHASAEWPALAPRLAALLGTVRRHAPAAPPAAALAHAPLRAVHWNIEHGNRYGRIEDALLHHDALAGADLVLLNEVDLGMARAGNRDVAGDLSRALGMHAVWAPLFLETTVGRHDDALTAGGGGNDEALFGIAVLARWPFGEVRIVELPSPSHLQFGRERMFGRHVALVAEVLRPGEPFVAVTAHLEVHRTRAHRAAQVRVLAEALRAERRPVVLSGDFNTHTFDRGLWHSPLTGAAALVTWPGPLLAGRLRRPDRGAFREPLFDVLRGHGFAWEAFTDFAPTLSLRLDRLDEVGALPASLRRATAPVLRWAERRGALRLDWFAGRGWADGRGRTVPGLDGRDGASDHAPIAAEFRSAGTH